MAHQQRKYLPAQVHRVRAFLENEANNTDIDAEGAPKTIGWLSPIFRHLNSRPEELREPLGRLAKGRRGK
jgi:hypothetical protein